MVYFSLVSTLYAARFEDAIILLDSEHDKYLSLIGSAATHMLMILENTFEHNEASGYSCITDNPTFDNEQLNFWISHFIQKNYIRELDKQSHKSIGLQPLKPGGLSDYQWDYKASWKPFAHASKYEFIKALIQLTRVHHLIKRKGIKGIIGAVQQAGAGEKNLHAPNKHEIDSLSAAVDAASLVYPKKTFCLAWAATFALLALRKKWDCRFVIGIQASPFYAHAWAEIAGAIINDDPVIAEVLSIILKEPY